MAHATFGAFLQATMADLIQTDGALGKVFQTGAFATGAALSAALVAVLLCADGARCHAAIDA